MMRFRLFGADVAVSFWFFALVAGFLLLDRRALFFYLALPILVHELGHLIALSLCAVRVRGVRLTALGIDIRHERGSVISYGRELAICACGPAANALMALLLHVWLYPTMRVMFLVAANLAIGLFNLLPIGDLDGGQICRLLTERFLAPDVARAISRFCSFFVLTGLFAGALFLLFARWHNPTLLVTCLYLAAQVIFKE